MDSLSLAIPVLTTYALSRVRGSEEVQVTAD